jgi:hypothetical protein
MTRYRKAYGTANTLQPADIKKLWKLHFAKQINMNEQQLMLNFKKDHLSTTELGKISSLTEGVFDVGVLTKLLTKVGASLQYYEPDAMVKSYLYQHSHSLGWDRDKLHFRNPKEKDSRNKGDSKSSNKRPSNDNRDSKAKRQKRDMSKARPSDQCRRKTCRQKGTNVNHTHKYCHFQNSERSEHKDAKARSLADTKLSRLITGVIRKTSALVVNSTASRPSCVKARSLK